MNNARSLIIPLLLAWFALVLFACSSATDEGLEVVPAGDASSNGSAIPGTVGWPTDWARHSVDLSELVVGMRGIPDMRDAIPPIDDPKFESIRNASVWLTDEEPVVLLELDAGVRAYPLRILASHEIINDQLGATPIAVTYCPQCTSAVAFERTVNGQTLRFGVSGLLLNNDLVMWDHATVSLWYQIGGEAIVGELTGTQLNLIPTPIVRFGDFRREFPQGEVLSRDTGFDVTYRDGTYGLEEE